MSLSFGDTDFMLTRAALSEAAPGQERHARESLGLSTNYRKVQYVFKEQKATKLHMHLTTMITLSEHLCFLGLGEA